MDRITGEEIIFISDNTTVVVYLKKQGESVSLNMQTGPGHSIVVRAVRGLHFIKVHYREEESSLGTGKSLLPWVFDNFCRDFNCPLVDLFMTLTNAKLPIYISAIIVPMV